MIDNEYKQAVDEVMQAIARKEKPTHLNVRYVPKDTMYHLKLMAAIERKSVKELVLELIEKKIHELEALGHRIR